MYSVHSDQWTRLLSMNLSFFSVNIFFGPVQGMGRRRRKAPAYTSLFVCIQWMRLTAWSLSSTAAGSMLTEAVSTSDSNDDDWRVRWQHTRPRNAARIDMRKQHYTTSSTFHIILLWFVSFHRLFSQKNTLSQKRYHPTTNNDFNNSRSIQVIFGTNIAE